MIDQHAPIKGRPDAILITRAVIDHERAIVLAEVAGSPQPFVTWAEDAAGNLFWGHYFETRPEASADFTKRVAAGH